MEHEDGHGVSAQELAQPAGAQSGDQGLPLILGEAQDHQQLEVTHQELGVNIDAGKLSL